MIFAYGEDIPHFIYRTFFRDGKIATVKKKYMDEYYGTASHYYKNIFINSQEAYYIDDFLDKYLVK